jgi:RimJ/RimL family protein N-acetyltransferase
MVRELGPGDLEPLLALRRRALLADPFAFSASPEDDVGLDPDFVRHQLGSPGRGGRSITLGAFAPQLVGMVGLAPERQLKARHKVGLFGLFVAPEQRRRGLAATLLGAAIERARRLDAVEQIQLAVSTRSEAAIRLYERHGFSRYGREPRALRVGDEYSDTLLMSLALRSELSAARARAATRRTARTRRGSPRRSRSGR